MQKIISSILLFLFAVLLMCASAQSFNTANTPPAGNLVTDSAYHGGNGNGLSQNLQSLQLTVVDSNYMGGAGNGFNLRVQSLTLSLTDSNYSGGNGSGFSYLLSPAFTLGISDSVYNGGPGSGFSTQLQITITLGIIDSLHNGGAGKGEEQLLTTVNLGSCTGDTIIWNGNVNVVWGNANNWDCGSSPGTATVVIIPSGLTNYPVVFSNVEVKSVILKPKSTIIVFNGALLKVNGY